MTGRKTAAPLQSARGAEEWSDGPLSVCFKKEGMSEAALLQAAEKAKKYYLRPAADTEGWQALQPFGQTEVLVSVIVPVHNGEKDLKQCLNSILAQECGSTVEIIADCVIMKEVTGATTETITPLSNPQ